jgi:cyclase
MPTMLPRVIPCLLLQGDGLVKTLKFKDARYVGDPVNTLRIFNEKEIDEIVILDITATGEGRKPRLELIRELASECFMPLCYGGGITTVAEIEAILRAGVEKVAINSACFTNPEVIREASARFGAQAIVAAIDVKKTLLGGYKVFSHGGKKNQGLDPVAHAKQMEALGAGEILLTSIDRDGTQEGYDLELVRKVTAAVGIPVVASGGAGKLDHFKEAVASGASAVAAGSFFVFHGKHRAVLITYPEHQALQTLFA